MKRRGAETLATAKDVRFMLFHDHVRSEALDLGRILNLWIAGFGFPTRA
jgi:hypothetical protein